MNELEKQLRSPNILTVCVISSALRYDFPLSIRLAELALLPPQSSQLQETGVQEGVIGLDRFNGFTD